MKLDHQKVVEIAERQGITLTSALERAGVSRTAYYSLIRRPSVLPRTVQALAATLGVDVLDFLAVPAGRSVHDLRLERARAICARKPEMDFHNVWHTLTLLEMSPVERLERSLRRGRGKVD